MFDFFKMFGLLGMTFSFMGDEGGGGTVNDDENPPAEGEPQPEANDDDLDDEGWVAKRGAKNVREELKRIRDEHKRLKEENETLKKPKSEEKKPDVKPEPNQKRQLPPHLEKKFQKWVKDQPEASRVNEEFMRDMFEAMVDTVIDGTRSIIGNDFKHLTKAEKKMANEELTETIKAIGSDASKPTNKFIVAKYEKEIIEAVKKEVPPEKWDDKEVIDYIVAKVYRDHAGKVDDDGGIEPAKKPIQEAGNGGGGVVGGSVSEDELREAAEVGNLDLSDAEDRKLARRLALSRKKISEAKSKK